MGRQCHPHGLHTRRGHIFSIIISRLIGNSYRLIVSKQTDTGWKKLKKIQINHIGDVFVNNLDDKKEECGKKLPEHFKKMCKCGHRIGQHTLGGYCTICEKGCGDILKDIKDNSLRYAICPECGATMRYHQPNVLISLYMYFLQLSVL